MIKYKLNKIKIEQDLKSSTEVITEVAEFYVALIESYIHDEDEDIDLFSFKTIKEYFTVMSDYEYFKKPLLEQGYTENEILTFLFMLYSHEVLSFEFADFKHKKTMSYRMFIYAIKNTDYFDMTFNYF